MIVWLSVLLSPIIFLLFYDVIFSYIPLIAGDAELPLEFVVYMVSVNIFCLLLLLYFVPYLRRRTRGSVNPVVDARGLSSASYLVLLVASILFFLILVNYVFQSFNVLNVYYNNQMFYTFSRRGGSWVYFFLNAFVFMILYDFYLHGFSKFKVLCFLGLVIVNAAAGSRGNIITYLLCFTLIYGVVWRGRRVFFIGLLAAGFVLMTFFYNTLSRSGSGDIFEYLESKASSIDFNQASAINDSLNYWDSEGGCYTCFIEDLSGFFIPRYFYPDKPMSNAETRLIYPNVAETGSTWTFGIYGSSIINMGVLAFLFVPFFYLGYSYFYFAALTSARKSFLKFSFIYFGANAIQFVRGGVLDVRLVRLLVTLFLVYFLYVLLRETISRLKLRLY